MEPLDLARTLPLRQRAVVYAKAVYRMVLPPMPWPVWMVLCSLGSLAAMYWAWGYHPRGLPELDAWDALAMVGLAVPALAVDGVLRMACPGGRSRAGYLALPALAAGIFAGYALAVAGPQAQSLARIESSEKARAKASELTERMQELERARIAEPDRAKVAKAIEAGLPGALKKVDSGAKVPALPPIPLPDGVAAASLPNPLQAAKEREQIESFEAAARIASSAMAADEAARAKQMQALSRELAELRAAPAKSHASWESVGEAKASLAWAAMASWLGSPVLAAVMGYGVRATAAIPAGWLAALWAWSMAKSRRGARAAASYALAPTPTELSELQARVAMHKKRVEEMRKARSMGPALPKAQKIEAAPAGGEQASFEPAADASAVAEAMAAIERARPARKIEVAPSPPEIVRAPERLDPGASDGAESKSGIRIEHA